MIFGYARVSTAEQNLDLQFDAFLQEGIDKKNIYTDKVSSSQEERKSLSKLLDYVRKGDTIVVWKLDRLARSLIHFTNFILPSVLVSQLATLQLTNGSRRYPCP